MKDWRVRIECLTQGALYHLGGVMTPLMKTRGVIFPYTPNTNNQYSANYADQNYVHSNYKFYFYNGSQVNDFSIDGVFTAQDSTEAEYMFAAIHFFRAATKMFYGNSGYRGYPPPILAVHGLGDHTYNGHPCVLTSFNYELPENVDYLPIVSSDGAAAATSSSSRLESSGLTNGSSSTNGKAYMPTKMTVTITLAPVQSREKSMSYNNKSFANGSLLTQGHW